MGGIAHTSFIFLYFFLGSLRTQPLRVGFMSHYCDKKCCVTYGFGWTYDGVFHMNWRACMEKFGPSVIPLYV